MQLPKGGLSAMAPEETRVLRAAGQKLLDKEAEFQFELARFVARGASGQWKVK